jgi:hypothetical protein
MVDHYDRFLILIGAVLAAGVLLSVHPSVALHQGLAGGSLVSTVVLYEVLFRNPPTEPTRSTTMATGAVGVSWLVAVLLTL